MECSAAMLIAANALMRDALAEADQPVGRIEIVCESDVEGIPFRGLGGWRYGQAMVTSERELIVLADRMPENEFIPTVEHEIAHILTWREYGLRVPVHGRQFSQMCTRIASSSPRKTCK